MNIKSNEIIKEITSSLNQLEREVSYNNSVDLFDINNFHVENFYAGLLNLIKTDEEYNYINLNSENHNFPAIDLGEKSKRVGVQITSSNDVPKIEKTFNTFFNSKKKLDEDYSEVFFLFIKGKGNVQEKEINYRFPTGFKFQKKKHLLDNTDLCKQISKTFEKNNRLKYLQDILSFVKERLPAQTRLEGKEKSFYAELIKNSQMPNGEIKILHSHGRFHSNFIAQNDFDLIISSYGYSTKKRTNETLEDEYLDHFEHIIEKGSPTLIVTPSLLDINPSEDYYVEDGLNGKLQDIDSINEFLRNEKDSNSYLGNQRIEELNKLEKQLYEEENESCATRYFVAKKVHIGEYNFGIVSINSVWRYYSGNEKLIIAPSHIKEALEYISDSEVKILVTHIPFDCLLDSIQDEVKKQILKFNLVFFNKNENTKLHSNFYENTFIQISDSEEVFSSITYSPKHRTIELTTYELNSKGEVIEAPETLKFTCPTKEIVEDGRVSHRYIDNIREAHIADFDSHLICYGISIVSQTLDKMFVMPLIVDSPFYNQSEKDVNEFSLKDLLSKKESVIIFGQKESGKTILLDQLLKSYVDEYQKYRKIPVYIDFLSIGTKPLNKIIREYISGNKTEIEKKLKSGEFVILIDNLQLGDLNEKTLNRVIKFSNDYRQVKIIATSIRLSENDTTEKKNGLTLFSFLYLQNFKTKHIKKLTENWFSNSEHFVSENYEQIVKSFSSFGLPNTPMSASLFLWIIEKQENKPINNAKLLEKFIESLLDKINKEEIYSGKFDYELKVLLLASIAQFMFENGKKDYSLDQGELIRFVSSYFKTNKLDTVYDSSKIVDNFIARGVFSKVGNDVKFRFASFFHFFLAKQMSRSQEFHDYVIKPEHYLRFIDEIDYFTGLERNKEAILKEVLERTESLFSELDTIPHNIINALFHSDFSIAEKINISNVVSGKPSEKDLEAITDNSIEQTGVKQDIPDKFEIEITDNEKLVKSLLLLQKVLKNTEIISEKEKDLKTKAYNKIVRFSTLSLFKDMFMFTKFYRENNELPDFLPSYFTYDGLLKILPIMYQVTLNENLGSKKLTQVFREKIDNDKQNSKVSYIEKFISVFTYSDVRGRDYFSVIEDFIKKNKSDNLVRDLSMVKIILYFFVRANKWDTQKEYLKLLNFTKFGNNSHSSFEDLHRLKAKLEQENKQLKE